MHTKSVFFFFFLFPFFVLAQTIDSLNVIQALEQFEFKDAASVPIYRKLFTRHGIDLMSDRKLIMTAKGIKAAKQFKNDSMFLNFSFLQVEVLFSELREYEKARVALYRIKPKVDASPSNEIRAYYQVLLGRIYDREGKSSKALDSYLKSYNFYKISNVPNRLTTSLYNISRIYANIGDFETALKYAYEMLETSHSVEGTYGLQVKMNAYYRLSGIFSNQESWDSAVYYSEKAIDIASKIDTILSPQIMMTCCHVYLGGIKLFSQKRDFEKAEALLTKAESCKRKEEALYLWALAEYYIEKEIYEKAGEILEQLPKKENSPYYSLYSSNLKSSYYQAIGDLEAALKEKNKAFDLKNEITKQERLQYAIFADAQYETVKKQEEIENLKQSKALEKQKYQLLSFAFFLLMVIFFLSLFAYRKIKNQASELQSVYEQRSKLFANIAHELRTPLTLISGPIHQIMRYATLKEDDKKLLSLAKKSSEDLVSISQQILDLNKSEIESIQPNLQKFNWLDFLNSYLPEFELQAKNRGLQFEKTIQEETFWVQTDLEKLKIILNNLFQNAFKFSQENGEIYFQSKQEGNQIVFFIRDTGEGIATKDQPHVFKRYYQSNHEMGGFGIGLSICKEYVQVINGKMTLESQEGQGTKISVSFPKNIPSNQLIEIHHFESNSKIENHFNTFVERSADTTKLLLIEDHEGLRFFLQNNLNREYDVFFAKNGKEGLLKLESIQPDLVITDWMMPVMNGLQFIEELRQDERWYNLPVLMLTARSFPLDKLKALQKGVNDYLVKPFEVDVLKVHIEHLLRHSESRKVVIESSESLDSLSIPSNTSSTISQNRQDLEWIMSVEKIVCDHLKDFDLNVSYLAEEVNLSRSYFSRKVKLITGMSPLQFINEIRFWEARKLLEEKQELSVKAVVYSVGFKSVKTFSRNFKRRFGVYPKDLLS